MDSLLRSLAEKASTNKGEWPQKYGTDFENDVFMMHSFCWCDGDDCDWCNEHLLDVSVTKYHQPENEPFEDRWSGAPNFHYKPTDLKVWWYKYIGRDVETNRPVTDEEVIEIFKHCFKSIGAELNVE